MEEKDDWTCGREGDRHPFTEINLQDEFVTPITLVLNYKKTNRLVLSKTYLHSRKTEYIKLINVDMFLIKQLIDLFS